MPETKAKRQSLPFDHLINDGSLAELISPVVAATITRRGRHAMFEYYGDELDLRRFREKEREWLARWYGENDPRLEAEREAPNYRIQQKISNGFYLLDQRFPGLSSNNSKYLE